MEPVPAENTAGLPQDVPRSTIIPKFDGAIVLLATLAIVSVGNTELLKICHEGKPITIVAMAAAFAIQIAVIALFCGRSSNPPWLKWTTMVWIFTLVNMQLMTVGVFQSDNRILPVASLFASQYGLLVTYLIMGSEHWVQRATVAGLLATLLSLAAIYVVHDAWLTILGCFIVSLVLTLVVLRVFGFRMIMIGENQAGGDLMSAQFGLRHAMILTTILAMMMAVLKSQETLFLNSSLGLLTSYGLVLMIVGFSSAIISELSCWAALGRGSYYVRYPVLILATLLLGVAVSYWFISIHQTWRMAPIGTRYTTWDWQLTRLAELGWLWVGWFALASLMLVSSLTFFRYQGLRFARGTKSQQSD